MSFYKCFKSTDVTDLDELIERYCTKNSLKEVHRSAPAIHMDEYGAFTIVVTSTLETISNEESSSDEVFIKPKEHLLTLPEFQVMTGISNRTYNCYRRGGYWTLKSIFEISREALLLGFGSDGKKIRNTGKNSAKEMSDALDFMLNTATDGPFFLSIDDVGGIPDYLIDILKKSGLYYIKSFRSIPKESLLLGKDSNGTLIPGLSYSSAKEIIERLEFVGFKFPSSL